MSDPNPDALLGRLAVHYKLVTLDQLSEVTRMQGSSGGKRLGDLLVEKGLITAAQLQQLVKVQQEYIAKRQQAGSAPAQGAKPASAPAARATAAPGSPAPRAAPAPAPAQRSPPARPAPAPAPQAPAQPEAIELATDDAPPAVEGKHRLDAYLARAVQQRASDLHVHTGAPLRLRISGKLTDLAPEPLGREESEALVLEVLSPAQREQLMTKGQVDFAYALPGAGRFRANAYRQQRGIDCVMRVIPPKPPSLTELGLPTSLAKLTNFHQGMVLITGPSGCGKSSTMAALLRIINEERKDHIITVEDPIEFVHQPSRCQVNQRQVGPHTVSFARALRAALREDPDIIALGELRDLETISLALTAAETGHLVLATLHTSNAIRTVNRLLGVFPPEQQAQIRTMVSESLRAVVSQRLVNRADGKGRVPVLEIMVVNKAIGNLIRENKTFQIRSAMQTGTAQGMCLLDTALAELVKAGTITAEEAARHADEPPKKAGDKPAQPEPHAAAKR